MSATTTHPDWDPALYARFERERAQPFHDLVARLPDGPVRRAADLGCGDGALTRTLAARWPDAEILGVDASAAMLAQATPDARLRFVCADLRAWTPDAPLDRIVSNAALQWLADHASLCARLVSWLAPGGALAVQMPANDDAPTHRIARALWSDARFADALGEPPPARRVHEPQWYAERMLALGCEVEAWETTYLHRLDGPDDVVTWVSGTLLRPVLSRLSGDAAAAFLAEYAERIRDAYPRGAHGTWLPFPRLFFVARRAR